MRASLKNRTSRKQWQGGRFSSRAYCVRAKNASPVTYTGTNTWILSDPESHQAVVVDPGPREESHLRTIRQISEGRNLRVTAILLTHSHPDHAAGAVALANEMKVPIFSRKQGNLEEGVFAAKDNLPLLEVVFLPGHSSDSVGFCFPADQSIVSGDLIFEQSPTLIDWPDGSLRDYFVSLERLRTIIKEQDYRCLLSAHGNPLTDPLTAIAQAEEHRLKRLACVRSVLVQTRSLHVDSVLAAVYDDIDFRLNRMARSNVQAQIDYLISINDPCIALCKRHG